MFLLSLTVAPVLVILCYIYFRDTYEKEPIAVLLKTFAGGACILFPVMFIEIGLDALWGSVHAKQGVAYAVFTSFFVAGFNEEIFKFAVLAFLIWRRKEFNERFDGIVYAVFVSLGFALVENCFYVLSGGAGVGVIRMFTAVPAHAMFGAAMGYYFGHARFMPVKRKQYLFLALAVPISIHGLYDFILLSKIEMLLGLFVPFMLYLLYKTHRFLKEHSLHSPSDLQRSSSSDGGSHQ